MKQSAAVATGAGIAPHGAPKPKTQMTLKVWGTTEANQAKAHAEAARGSSRQDWDFTEIEYLGGAVNPLNKKFGHAIAADWGDGWAYAVYPAEVG